MPRLLSRSAQRYSLFIGIFLLVCILGVVVYLLTRKPVTLGANDFATPVAHAYALMYSGGGVSGSVKDSAGTTLTTFEFAPADRLHITTLVGSVKYESIRAEGTLYTLSDSGKWRRAALPPQATDEASASIALPIKPFALLSALSAQENNKSVFTESPKSECPAENRNCKVYREALANQQTQVYYIDASSGNLFRMDHLSGSVLDLSTRYEHRAVTVNIPTNEQTDTTPISLSPQPTMPPEVLQKLQEASQP